MKISNNYISKTRNVNVKKTEKTKRIKLSDNVEFSEISLKLYLNYLNNNQNELAIINFNDINMMEQIQGNEFKKNPYYRYILSHKVSLIFKG